MRKALSLSAVLIVLVVAGVVIHQQQADAAGCIRCMAGYTWTPGQWGFGSTCAQAETNAISAAYGYAGSQCPDGVCAYGAEEIVTPCMWVNNQYKADGRIQYRCGVYICQ